jgi:hypothetical protein
LTVTWVFKIPTDCELPTKVNTIPIKVGDRKNLTAWSNGDNLVNAVAAVNKNTVVVVNSVGPLILEPWIDNPNVTAVRNLVFFPFAIWLLRTDQAPSEHLGHLGRFGRI